MGSIWKMNSTQRDDAIRGILNSVEGSAVNRSISDVASAAARIMKSGDPDLMMLVGVRIVEVGNELIKEALVRELATLTTPHDKGQ